jgi:1-acyl-sn-glycerol-3-phosphate acyltransferase
MSGTRFQTLGVLERLKEMHLPRVPYMQILIARTYLALDYRFPKPTTLSIDGLEKMEHGRPFLVAMNHTDRYNYAPFMAHLDKVGLPPLAPWVKGKYYLKPWLATLLLWCACTPVPSRGFLLTLDWLARMNRPPREDEYRQLRLIGDGLGQEDELLPGVAEYLMKAPGGGREEFFPLFQEHFESLSAALVRINVEALELGYRPLIFPQGTRSKRLTPGFSGIVQMALHLKVPILPVAVSGSEKLYPGNRALSKGGHVHYTIGELYDPSREEGAPTDFMPLTIAASRQHGEAFSELTTRLMDRLNDLLPEEYQYAPEGLEATRRKGIQRFV